LKIWYVNLCLSVLCERREMFTSNDPIGIICALNNAMMNWLLPGR
jgi:hypothetical protein